MTVLSIVADCHTQLLTCHWCLSDSSEPLVVETVAQHDRLADKTLAVTALSENHQVYFNAKW